MKYLVDKQLILDLIADLGPGDAYAEITKEFLAVQKEYEDSVMKQKRVDTLRKALVEYLGEDTDRVDAIIKELDTPVVNCSSIKNEKMSSTLFSYIEYFCFLQIYHPFQWQYFRY